MSVDTKATRIDASATNDIAYVRSHFDVMPEASRALAEDGILPQPTYRLPDGTPMVPPDHRQLLDDADNNGVPLADYFRSRYVASGGSADDVDEEFAAWLSGGYGACLYATIPEMIVAKGALTSAITALTARPQLDDPHWRAALRGAVDAFDGLIRPFADFDRMQAGGSVSRDRLVTANHESFPEVWRS
jgi:hypothetical protein